MFYMAQGHGNHQLVGEENLHELLMEMLILIFIKDHAHTQMVE